MSLFIVVTFLIITLLVGIYFSRKKTTFREYAVGNKQFSTATLIATLLATAFGGGGIVRNIESIHALGLYWIVILLFASSLILCIIARFTLRMGPFMHHLSMAETIGSIYGKYPRIIAALVGICGSIAIITAQINVMSKSISMCLVSIDPSIITVLSTLLLIFYSTFGGVRAVTYTDVLQFITFSTIIPLLGWFMFIKAGKPITVIVPMLQSQPKFQFSTLFRFDKQLVNMLLVFLACMMLHIKPDFMQRIYMASSPIQAKRVYFYSTLFHFIISFFIILIALFVFIGAPDLPKTEIWNYIITHIPPSFKGVVAISLLAMAMSTADSSLNVCSVMMSHDIVKSLYNKKMLDIHQLKLARWTTLVIGLLAMLLAFHCQDLLKLLFWVITCSLPVTVAPFILSIFGFRGTSRTALIGMTAGVLTILVWKKWVEPSTGMDGSFLAALANGLAMMAAHYLFKQPKSAGWVRPDDTFKQMQQENARKRAAQKEVIKNALGNKKVTLARLKPSHINMVYIGLYTTITSKLTYCIAHITHHGCWLILQLFVAACFLGYPFLYDISKKIRATPNWVIGLCWLVWLAVYLPINLLWHWWHLVDPIFTTCLSLIHCAVILWLLPLYLAIGVVAATSLVAIYPIVTGLSSPLLSSLFPLFVVSILLMVAGVICFKVKVGSLATQMLKLTTSAIILYLRSIIYSGILPNRL